MVTENCVWRNILKCCVWHLILKHCAWRVISKHCDWRQSDARQTPARRQPDAHFWNQASGADQMPARCPPDASQTQCFEIRCLTQDFKTLRLTPARRQADAMFQNQASDTRFQNHAPDVSFCDHASDVQYESSYVPDQHKLCVDPTASLLPICSCPLVPRVWLHLIGWCRSHDVHLGRRLRRCCIGQYNTSVLWSVHQSGSLRVPVNVTRLFHPGLAEIPAPDGLQDAMSQLKDYSFRQ